MSYSPYATLALIPSQAQFDMAKLAELLRPKFESLTADEYQIALKCKDYLFSIYFEEGSDVISENKEILKILKLEDTMIQYMSRLSWQGNKTDFNMEFFNEHIYICEAVEQCIAGVILFDSNSATII